MTDAPTLFSVPSLPRVPFGEHPRTRTSDPRPSRLAAAEVAKGAGDHEALILRVLEATPEPLTAFDIARFIGTDRWDEGSTRTAVSRLKDARRLFEYDQRGVSPRGRSCTRYSLTHETVRVGEAL